MTDEERAEAEIKTPGLIAKLGGNGATVVAVALIAVIAWVAYLYATAAEPPGALLMVIGMLVGLLGWLCNALAAKLRGR